MSINPENYYCGTWMYAVKHVLGQCFSNVNVHKDHLGFLLNADSDSVGLGVDGLRFFISNELLGNADDAGAGTTIP